MQRLKFPFFILLVLASHFVVRYQRRAGPTVYAESSGPENGPALILLHGAAGSGEDFSVLTNRLNRRARIWVPDLPGFGRSRKHCSDRSLTARARLLWEAFDAGGAETNRRVQVIGFGLGGPLAFEMETQRPDRVASVGLIGGTAVVDRQLLRDPGLNHAIYGAWSAVYFLGDKLVPHFGLLDRFRTTRSTALSLLAADLDSLRDTMSAFEKPIWIGNGRSDGFIGKSTIEEHLRIMPQAQMAWVNGGHWEALASPELADSLANFVRQVEAGQGVPRQDAASERRKAAELPFERQPFQGRSLLLILLLLMVAMQTSEDLTCIGAGLMVSKGVLGFTPAALGCFFGVMLGDSKIYLAGRFLGRPALSYPPLKWFIRAESVDKQARRFNRNLFPIVFGARFIPGARVPAYFTAGMMKGGFWRFETYLALAGLVWIPLLVGSSALMGQAFIGWFETNKVMAAFALIGAVIALYVGLHKILPLLTWSGRRQSLGSWRRKLCWEYWPRWAVYPPVLLYIFWLAIRYRGLRTPLVTNPGMKYSGLITERKSEIFESLAEAGDCILPFCSFSADQPTDEKIAKLKTWRQENSIDGVIVLKPDIGYRGQGVSMIANEAEAMEWFASCPVDAVAQPKVDGKEFGVFYVRHPNEDSGQVVSITRKEPTTVTGDGEHDLEHLILADDRAVCMAPFFLKRWTAELERVPDEGEVVQLNPVGAHCRGARFLDGSELLTTELTTEIDRISRAYEGFYLGRYDLIVENDAALKAGKNLQVLELNGITAEMTHIYDPKYSVWTGWKTLKGQWRRAFEIGAVNRKAGHKPPAWREVLGVLWRGLRQKKVEAP